jgi:hypothetical protein
MKKVILSVTMLFTVAVSTSFANTDPITNEEVEASFKKEFAGAESVIWKEDGEYFKASFVLNGYVVDAFFSPNGELEGSLRSLQYNQLPLNVTTAVNKRFVNPEVLNVYEISNANGTSYRITITTEGKKFRFKSDASGNIMDKEKIKF